MSEHDAATIRDALRRGHQARATQLSKHYAVERPAPPTTVLADSVAELVHLLEKTYGFVKRNGFGSAAMEQKIQGYRDALEEAGMIDRLPEEKNERSDR